MDKYKFPYHTVSAKNNENIEELFYSILDSINELNLNKNKSRKITHDIDNDYENPPLTVEPIMKKDLHRSENETENDIKLKQESVNENKKCFC